MNDELMRVFMACGLVEQSGHGVPLVVEEYGESAYHFEGDFIKIVKGIVKNPLIISSLLALLINFIGIEFPGVVVSSMSSIASIATPFAE